MIKNYLLVALRTFNKSKGYLLINLIGLTMGLSISLLTICFVVDEFSYDSFHPNSNRLFRLQYNGPNDFKLAQTPPPISPLLVEYFPEVELSGRLYGRNVSTRIVDAEDEEKGFEETRVFFADSSIRKIFNFELLAGSKSGFLTDNKSIYINQQVAERYFGNENPIGKTINLEGEYDFMVAGVFNDFPDNSHIHFNILLPYETMFMIEPEARSQRMRERLAINFIISHSYTYVLLKPGATVESFNKRMLQFTEEKITGVFQVGQEFVLEPVKDIHLKSELIAQVEPTSSLEFNYAFIGIAILTLLMAIVNFINLTTAQSFKRIKEIGLRKVFGADKKSLAFQFLIESLMICIVSWLLSYVISYFFLLDVVNSLTQKSLTFYHLIEADTTIGYLFIVIITGLLAGGYPSFVISRFRLIPSLKGLSSTKSKSNLVFKNALLIFQFMISVGLISGAYVINNQTRYLRNMPLGFEKDAILNIPMFSQNTHNLFGGNGADFYQKIERFQNEISKNPKVITTSLSSGAPGMGTIYRGIIPDGFTREDNMFGAVYSIDNDFIDTYNIKLVAGRNFIDDHPSDISGSFIINETAVNNYNWKSPEDALGKQINLEGKIGNVIGVMKDFYFSSLENELDGVIMEMRPQGFQLISVKISSEEIPGTIEHLKSHWNQLFPEKVFEYNFLDDTLDATYSAEANLAQIIDYLAAIAVIICCLGTFGILSYNLRQKQREIGIRKVLGATTLNILFRFYRTIVFQCLMSILLVSPIVYLVMKEWLTQFSYHIHISYLHFIIPAVLVSVITILVVSYQSIKAARSNPIESIRID
ncbi:MAG: FtsX-like permease family protein [Fulvivirga sp.]|uniref:ABC transporter permease n=1 Tax=Fulvivirga sp. TaxID=1931237 RepID=UPI0032EC4B13